MTKHQTISVLPVQDRVRGCLIGGAAGDALGYPVEFFSEPATGTTAYRNTNWIPSVTRRSSPMTRR